MATFVPLPNDQRRVYLDFGVNQSRNALLAAVSAAPTKKLAFVWVECSPASYPTPTAHADRDGDGDARTLNTPKTADGCGRYIRTTC